MAKFFRMDDGHIYNIDSIVAVYPRVLVGRVRRELRFRGLPDLDIDKLEAEAPAGYLYLPTADGGIERKAIVCYTMQMPSDHSDISILLTVDEYKRLCAALEVECNQETPSHDAVLDQSIFNRSDCPYWAEYAAMEADGRVYWYDIEPKIDDNMWSSSGRAANVNRYEWDSSLIKRKR